MLISIRYSDHLKSALEQCEDVRGSEFVRLALSCAASKLLESRNYKTTRVIDLCREAGISRATYYLHFDSKEALFTQIAAGLVEFELNLMPTLHDFDDAYDALLALCRWFTDFFSTNMHLIEACAYLADTTTEVGEVWTKRSERRKTRILRELQHFPEFSGRSIPFSMFILDTIGRGMNRIMYSMYGRLPERYKEPERPANPDFLPELFAGLMYQCLFCKEPPASKFVASPKMFSTIISAPMAEGVRKKRNNNKRYI